MTLIKSTMTMIAAAALTVTGVGIAHAGDNEGRFQVKVLATGVLPDGEITNLNIDNFGVPAGSQTDVSDAYVPTIAAEYFFTSNISVETICCVAPVDVDGRGAINGVQLINNAVVLPASVTAKYHVTAFDQLKPYVGVGATHFFFLGHEAVGDGGRDLGITRAKLSNEFGFLIQAGVDVPINDNGWVATMDMKRYFIDTTASFSNGSGLLFQTEHSLDPWVVSFGVGYRF